jgi:hypothetical protein
MEDVGIFYGHLVHFMDIWSVLRSFGPFYGQLVYFVVIWYLFSSFGSLYKEKSDNPGASIFVWAGL